MDGTPGNEDWKDYPESLDTCGSGSYQYNLPSYNQQIKEDAKRLFIPESDRIAVKIIDIASEGTIRCNLYVPYRLLTGSSEQHCAARPSVSRQMSTSEASRHLTDRLS